MKRLRLYDLRNYTTLPTDVGYCRGDVQNIAAIVNSAQRRLLYAKEAGDEGWWGTWAEIAFRVNRLAPYWTAPREVARLMSANVCQRPVQLQNQFFEYLQFGNGRLPKTFVTCEPRIEQIFTRNNVPTFVDLSSPPQYLRVYFTDPADIQAGRRALLQGTDNNDNVIYTQDGVNQVTGVYVNAQAPFSSPIYRFNTLTGVQKDVTLGTVKIFQADPTTGDEVLLLTMEPGEETASYRRYYFSGLPATCCFRSTTPQVGSQNLTVTGIVKLDLIPVVVDTDYCLIQNAEALVEEAQSVRYSKIDTTEAKKMAQEKHLQAIRLLNGELAHYLGIDEPAVEFSPFGAAKLEKLKIGTML